MSVVSIFQILGVRSGRTRTAWARRWEEISDLERVDDCARCAGISRRGSAQFRKIVRSRGPRVVPAIAKTVDSGGKKRRWWRQRPAGKPVGGAADDRRRAAIYLFHDILEVPVIRRSMSAKRQFPRAQERNLHWELLGQLINLSCGMNGNSLPVLHTPAKMGRHAEQALTAAKRKSCSGSTPFHYLLAVHPLPNILILQPPPFSLQLISSIHHPPFASPQTGKEKTETLLSQTSLMPQYGQHKGFARKDSNEPTYSSTSDFHHIREISLHRPRLKARHHVEAVGPLFSGAS